MKILMRASQNPFDNFNAFDTLLTDKLWANIGNLLFPYSLYRNLFSENTSIETIAGIPHPDEAAEINENYDMLLLPFANAFRPSFISQLNRWTALVKELKIQLLELLRTVNLSIGTRIHGNIAAVLAGTPSFIIATDFRMLELAQYHNLPYQTSAEFDYTKTIREIYEKTDFKAVNRGHKERYENFMDFLKANDLMPLEQPNRYFDNKMAETDSHPPFKSIVNIGSEEAAERLNNYLGHLIRKNNKMQKELDRMKNIRMER